MNCDQFRRYELGELDASTFEQHTRACNDCQRQRREDEALLFLARQLQRPVASPLLWAKIENSLRAERRRASRMRSVFSSPKKLAAWALAASLVLASGLGTWLQRMPDEEDRTRVLNAAALQRVEQKEKEYEAALAELERVTTPQLAQMDLDLMLRYRDRLETIEAQIALCRAALAENPGNAHIRRYLFMALQDKRNALQELAGRREG